jgi:hypothetical protein
VKIKGDALHCRVYRWWYKKKYKCEPSGSTNLCPYFRAVVFWAPSRVVFWNWIKFGPIPLNVISIPAIALAIPKLIGYYNYSIKHQIFMSYLFFLACFLVSGITVGILWAFSSDGGGFGGYVIAFLERTCSSSFWILLREYLRSAHDRVCPEIEVDWNKVHMTVYAQKLK